MAADILVVEDDAEMRDVLRLGFEQAGHSVALAADGADALDRAARGAFRAIVLDVMLPVHDGLHVAATLRARGDVTPILMLTARGFVDDVVRGLEAGAEDYLAKPFAFLELLARVRGLMRRQGLAPSRRQAADLVLDRVTQRVTCAGRDIALSRAQYVMLDVLMRSLGQVVRRRELVDAVWGVGVHVEANTVDVAVRALRAAIRADGAPRIHTVRGFGYRLDG